MPTKKRYPSKDQRDCLAQEALKRLYEESGRRSSRKAGRQSNHSWRSVADHLGFNVGYIHSVAMGFRRPSNALLIELGLPPRRALADVCPIHGIVHPRKTCPPAKPAAPRAHNWQRECKVERLAKESWQDVALKAIGALIVDVGGEAQTGYIME